MSSAEIRQPSIYFQIKPSMHAASLLCELIFPGEIVSQKQNQYNYFSVYET